MDRLMNYHSLDICWGNHDIVWMGAAAGSFPCIATVLRICARYGNLDILEDGYGINMIPLATFASRVYGDDPCTLFKLKGENCTRLPNENELNMRMHKAISIIQFKLEGQLFRERPEFQMQDRMLLDKIDYERGVIRLGEKEYTLLDHNFPTIDPADPYRLSPEEEEVMIALEASILRSDKLQEHIQFLYSHGALYKTLNGNLMFHGCIPFTEDGEFRDVTINGITQHGAKLMEYLDKELRDAYFNPPKGKTRAEAANLMWYLWLGPDSPLFG